MKNASLIKYVGSGGNEGITNWRDAMILIGLGSNVEGPWGTPRETVREALNRLDGEKTALVKASRLLISKAIGPVEQDDYVNAAAIITTDFCPTELMRHLHDIELQSDRRRTVRWGPRTLDLDILDYNGLVLRGEGEAYGHQKPLNLPHPEIANRAFVLAPLAEIAPDWRHPLTGLTAKEMLDRLDVSEDAFSFLV